MPTRDVRYQGAILRDDHILLIKHREHESGRAYWVIPGGGRENGESEEQCVQREMLEETGLVVEVTRLLLEDPDVQGGSYRWRRTFLCNVIAGEAAPGYEPESEASEVYGIVQVAWFDLRRADSWDPDLISDPITYPLMERLRAALGYSSGQDS